jgi:hypothetical protein
VAKEIHRWSCDCSNPVADPRSLSRADLVIAMIADWALVAASEQSTAPITPAYQDEAGEGGANG